jgi:hypothetical protein
MAAQIDAVNGGSHDPPNPPVLLSLRLHGCPRVDPAQGTPAPDPAAIPVVVGHPAIMIFAGDRSAAHGLMPPVNLFLGPVTTLSVARAAATRVKFL